jgi:uncharacterized protein YndB with AHSA1/START domain
MMIQTIRDHERVITQAIDCRAPKRKVFETWTQPEWLKRWFFADVGMECRVAEVDLRVGGKYRLSMAMPGGPETVFDGSYQAIAIPDALVYTWHGGEGEHVTLVTALFHDRDKGTRIDFTHGVFATVEAKEAHAKGWTACLKSLERLLESD